MIMVDLRPARSKKKNPLLLILFFYCRTVTATKQPRQSLCILHIMQSLRVYNITHFTVPVKWYAHNAEKRTHTHTINPIPCLAMWYTRTYLTVRNLFSHSPLHVLKCTAAGNRRPSQSCPTAKPQTTPRIQTHIHPYIRTLNTLQQRAQMPIHTDTQRHGIRTTRTFAQWFKSSDGARNPSYLFRKPRCNERHVERVAVRVKCIKRIRWNRSQQRKHSSRKLIANWKHSENCVWKCA